MVNQISRMASGCAKSAGVGVSRASSLDVLKCLAAFCVVWIHFGSGWLSPITRCAVPIFFVITGYYYPMMVESGKFWKHIKKLLMMVLCSAALYGAYTLQDQVRNDTLGEWISETFRLRNIARFLVFNTDMMSGHLWFFWAVLYGLIIFYLADKWRLTKWLRYAIPLLLLVHFIRNYTPFPLYCARNFLFMGLPCMMVGRCIREHKDKPLRFLSNERYFWIYTFGSLLLVCGEILLLRVVCSDNGVRDMYIFTLPVFLPYFYWALQHPCFGEGSWLSAVGRKYSAYIYIFHMLVGSILSDIVELDTPLFTKFIYPFLVFGVSLCMAWLFARLLKWMKSIAVR